MKKIILSLVILLLCPIFVASATEYINGCDAFLQVVTKSENLKIYSNNVASFDGDTARIGRNDNDEAFLTYEINNICEINAIVYSDKLVDENNIRFLISEDSENFVEVKMYRSLANDSVVGYQKYSLVVCDIPRNSKYLRIVFPQYKKFSVYPQLGEIRFSDEKNLYTTKGLLFYDEFENSSKMYDISSNFRFENGKSSVGDDSRCLRVYDLKSGIKYNIKKPINMKLSYFVMDGKGEVEIFTSSTDSKYKPVKSKTSVPKHVHNNWSKVELTVEEFPNDTQFIWLVIPKNNHASWPPMLSELEVYY